MKYESKRTAKGNVGCSFESQELADSQAKVMDEGNNENCYACSRCSGCSYCSRCSYCSDCSGVLRWMGGDAKNLVALNGLKWLIAVSETRMQIGCQNHTHEDWKRFDDVQIAAMSPDALEFWKEWKPTLMAMCEYKKGAKR